jgi:hypothetical protein
MRFDRTTCREHAALDIQWAPWFATARSAPLMIGWVTKKINAAVAMSGGGQAWSHPGQAQSKDWRQTQHAVHAPARSTPNAHQHSARNQSDAADGQERAEHFSVRSVRREPTTEKS